MTKEEKNKLILDQWTKEGLAQRWIEEHIKYNNVKEELEELEERIDKAIRFCGNFKKKFRYDLLKHCHLDDIVHILLGDE